MSLQRRSPGSLLSDCCGDRQGRVSRARACLGAQIPLGGSFPLGQHRVLLSGYCRKNFPPVDEQPVVNNHHRHSQHFPLLPNLPRFYPAVVYRLVKISSLPVSLQGATWSCSEHRLRRVSWDRGIPLPLPALPAAPTAPAPAAGCERLSSGSAPGHTAEHLGSCSGSCFHFSSFSDKGGMSILHWPFCLTGNPDHTGT